MRLKEPARHTCPLVRPLHGPDNPKTYSTSVGQPPMLELKVSLFKEHKLLLNCEHRVHEKLKVLDSCTDTQQTKTNRTFPWQKQSVIFCSFLLLSILPKVHSIDFVSLWRKKKAKKKRKRSEGEKTVKKQKKKSNKRSWEGKHVKQKKRKHSQTQTISEEVTMRGRGEVCSTAEQRKELRGAAWTGAERRIRSLEKRSIRGSLTRSFWGCNHLTWDYNGLSVQCRSHPACLALPWQHPCESNPTLPITHSDAPPISMVVFKEHCTLAWRAP